MSLGEQLNELDRKVLGAAPVDRSEPAAPYTPSVGDLAPLSRTVGVRAGLYAPGALPIGVPFLLGGGSKTLLLVIALVVIPEMLVAKLSTNPFPPHLPEAAQ